MKRSLTLSKEDYLSALKSKMDSRFSFGKARFTGCFLGPLFSVTYHSGYEWNRRITGEKNSAIGYVRKAGDGCEVRYLHTKGFLYPSGFLSVVFLFTIVFLICSIPFREPGWRGVLTCIGFGAGTAALAVPIRAYMETYTDRSEEGAKILTACMTDPTDPS